MTPKRMRLGAYHVTLASRAPCASYQTALTQLLAARCGACPPLSQVACPMEPHVALDALFHAVNLNLNFFFFFVLLLIPPGSH